MHTLREFNQIYSFNVIIAFIISKNIRLQVVKRSSTPQPYGAFFVTPILIATEENCIHNTLFLVQLYPSKPLTIKKIESTLPSKCGFHSFQRAIEVHSR